MVVACSTACGDPGGTVPIGALHVTDDPAREVRLMSVALERDEPPATPSGAAPRIEQPPPPHVVVRTSEVARTLIAEAWVAAFAGEHAPFAIELQRNSDRGAIEEVAAGRAVAAFTIDPPSEQERATGVEAVVLGHDAAVLVVANDNPLRTVSAAQARGLCNGHLTHWRELTAFPGDIALVLGPGGPLASQRKSLLIAGDRMPTDVSFAPSDAAALQQVARTPAAITLTGFDDASHARDVRMLAIDGTPPDLGAIRSGRYAATTTVYLVTPWPSSAASRALSAFARSARGQAVVQRSLIMP